MSGSNSATGSWKRTGLAWLVAFCFALAALAPQRAEAIGVRDAEIEEFLRDISDPILEAAGLDPRAVNLYMLNDPSLNAFVANGQNIFFHSGIILASDVPNELIGVIAHEAGHIAGGHITRLVEQFSKVQTPLLISLLAGVAAAAAGAPDAGIAILAGTQQVAERSLLSYNRTQESAADQAALTFLNATGQSGRGLIKFFDRFRDQEALSTPSQDPYIRTHPLSSSRVATLTASVEQSPHKDAKDSAELKHRFDMIKAKIVGFLRPEYITFQDYPETDRSQPARYARTVAYFRLGQMDQSIAEIDSLIAEEPENPYFYELKGQVLFERGQTDESIPWHRKAVELKPNSGLLKLNVGRGILAKPDHELTPELVKEARILLEEAVRLDPSYSFSWHQLAIAYAREGKEPMANLATAERFTAVGNLRRALGFARRAADQLPTGSPAWRRATDIVAFAEAKIPKERPRNPR